MVFNPSLIVVHLILIVEIFKIYVFCFLFSLPKLLK